MSMPFRDGQSLRLALLAAGKKHSTFEDHTDAVTGWVMQRLLARLAHASNYEWALKGGQALIVRLPHYPRTTYDIDAVMAAPSIEEAVQGFVSAIQTPLPDTDFLTFDLIEATPSPIRPDLVKLTIGAMLEQVKKRKRLNHITIDVLVARKLATDPDMIVLHPRFDVGRFTDWPTIPVVSTAQHIAEKLAAMYTLHNGRPSSRERDFADLVFLCRDFPPPHKDLVHFLHETARAPRNASTDLTFPPTLTISDANIRRYERLTGAPPLDEAIQIVEAVVNPALADYHAECASGNTPACGEGATRPHAPTNESAGKREHEEQADAENVVRGRERFWHTLHTAHPRPFHTHGNEEASK